MAQLCETCDIEVFKKCEWPHGMKPVEGWKAKKVNLENSEGKIYETYIILVGTGVIAISLCHEVRNTLHVTFGRTRDIVVGIRHTIGRGAPAVDDSRSFYHLSIDEEEEFVLDDGTTEGEAVSGGTVLLAGTGDLLVVHSATAHILITMVYVSRPLEGVGTALRDSIHAAADEVGLAHIER